MHPTFVPMPLLDFRLLAPAVGRGLWLLTESEADLLALAPTWLDAEGIPIRFTHPQRRREWLAGRVLAAEILQQLTGTAGATVAVVTDAFGRPRLETGTAGALSLTHGGGHVGVLVALGAGARAALDLEPPRAKTLTLASRFLNPAELAAVGADPDRAALAWSLKETLYKAYGRRQLDFRRHLDLDLTTAWPPPPRSITPVGVVSGRILHPTDPARYWTHDLHYERHPAGWLTSCYIPSTELALCFPSLSPPIA